MGLFSGRDRNASNHDFLIEGSAAAALLKVVVVTATPVVDGFQSQSVTSTAAALTSIPGASTHALISVSPHATNGIRFREDTTNPTATVGMWVGPGGAAELTNLSAVRVIGTDGTTGATSAVSISYRHYNTS